MMKGNYNIAIYLRLSLEDNDKKDESNSIINQRHLLQGYIFADSELKKGNIIEYQDDGYSGTNFDRPGIKKLLRDVKSDAVNCIIVKDFSRFSRDYIELGSYLEQIFPFMGIRFISVTDCYDSKAYRGQTIGLDMQFKTLLYDFYSKDLSVKYKNAVMSKCEQGQYVFGRCPLGYEKIPDTKHEIRINEFEGNIVKRIFSEAISGKSTNMIAKGLNGDRVPTFTILRGIKRNNDERETVWQGATICKILNNRFYVGEWVYNRVKVTSVGSSKMVKRPQEEWKVVTNHHEALISEEDFKKAKECLEINKKHNCSVVRKREKHALTGKIFCGGCGYALTYKREGKHSYFRCDYSLGNRKEECCKGFNVVVLEELMLNMLNKEILKLGELSDLHEMKQEEMKELISKEKVKLSKYEKMLLEKEDEKQMKYLDYVNGKISGELFKREAKLIDGVSCDLGVKIEKINKVINRLMKECHKDIKDLKGMIKFLNVRELSKEVVEVFFEKVYLYDGKRVEIRWGFDEFVFSINLSPM